MGSFSRLALVLGASAPLLFAPSSARADEPASAPPAAPASAPAAAPATAPSPASDTAAPGADGLVQVHIQTKELVTIEHRSGASGAWVKGCETPCDARLPAADEFRIVGEGVNESEPFVLTSPKGDAVKIHVAPGLKKREKTGEILAVTGGVVFVGSVVLGLAAADPGGVFAANGATNNYNWNVIGVSTGLAVAGLVTGIFGATWWYDNSHTRVAGDVQGDQPARGGLEPRYQTGFRSEAPTIPVYSATVFSTSF